MKSLVETGLWTEFSDDHYLGPKFGLSSKWFNMVGYVTATLIVEIFVGDFFSGFQE